MTYDFKAWGKTPRWSNEEMTITEKIDGTNACIVILPFDPLKYDEEGRSNFQGVLLDDDTQVLFAVQSRTRFITPEKGNDNAGFAAWAYDHQRELIETLGYGRHYGEWWGSGIQGGYGLEKGDKRFSLFDVWRWDNAPLNPKAWVTKELSLVPTLYHGPASESAVREALWRLQDHGSVASPGYKNPEGVIVSYKLTRQSYKAFVKDDGIPKTLKEGL